MLEILIGWSIIVLLVLFITSEEFRHTVLVLCFLGVGLFAAYHLGSIVLSVLG